jgi:hypothetical protein
VGVAKTALRTALDWFILVLHIRRRSSANDL